MSGNSLLWEIHTQVLRQPLWLNSRSHKTAAISTYSSIITQGVDKGWDLLWKIIRAPLDIHPRCSK